MALNLEGIGGVFMRQSGKLRPLRISSAKVAQETEDAVAQAYPSSSPGALQTSDTLTTSSKWTITLESESIDTLDLDLVFNQGQADIASIAVPQYVVGTIPSASPYDVTVTGITTSDVPDVTVLSSTAPGNVVLTASDYTVAANKITMAASTYAGKAVGVYWLKTGSLTKARGGPNVVSAPGNLEFFFRYKFTRTASRSLWFPEIAKSGGVSFEPGGDNISLEFTASVPSGWQLPFLEW